MREAHSQNDCIIKAAGLSDKVTLLTRLRRNSFLLIVSVKSLRPTLQHQVPSFPKGLLTLSAFLISGSASASLFCSMRMPARLLREVLVAGCSSPRTYAKGCAQRCMLLWGGDAVTRGKLSVGLVAGVLDPQGLLATAHTATTGYYKCLCLMIFVMSSLTTQNPACKQQAFQRYTDAPPPPPQPSPTQPPSACAPPIAPPHPRTF